jgi:hypothetical protein
VSHTTSENTLVTPPLQRWIWDFFVKVEAPVRTVYLHDLPGDTSRKRRYIP